MPSKVIVHTSTDFSFITEFTSAPALIKVRTTFACPLSQADIKGRFSYINRKLTSNKACRDYKYLNSTICEGSLAD